MPASSRTSAGSAWRRRLLPLGAVILFLLIWWQAVVQFDIKPFIAPSPGGGGARCWSSASES